MKKSILAILLAVLIAAPVFASEKNDKELDLKAGYTLDNNVKLYLDDGKKAGSTDKTCVLGAEFYYYVNSQVALGLGVNNFFDAAADYRRKDNYSFTNIYFAVRPKMNLDSEILDSLYFIGQIGYGLFRFSADSSSGMGSVDTENGLYWAMGVGLEIMDHFILEVIHSFNYGYLKVNNNRNDMRYSALTISVGYKFKL